jgi:prepilin-type N-terminal cleavage/methylation domain-containing protein/prepilin-type processing-associated H-X9-DG protein
MRYAGKSRATDAPPAPAGPGERGTEYPYPVVCKSFSNSNLRIINHQLSFINRRGFTLIELLVVVSIIALLLAILLPALRAGRAHARTAACQSILHQWGLYYAMYTAENDYKLPPFESKAQMQPDVLPHRLYERSLDSAYSAYGDLNVYRRLFFCPEASGLPVHPDAVLQVIFTGRTHSPWARHFPDDPAMSSYGFNGWTPMDSAFANLQVGKPLWVSCAVKGAATVPVYFDCMEFSAWPQETDVPAPVEDALDDLLLPCGMATVAMDRHRGGINSLFMDWSVRKVGLKEAWTLKWSPTFNTTGPWTKAGGVKAEDWPEWMRRFKDY